MILPLLSALSLLAAGSSLGQADFPVTGSEASRAHFQHGLLNLHSFMYEDAADDFKAATAAEPGFVMGRWGEAMSYNHAVWNEQDTDAAKAALSAIGDLSQVTPLEREWVEAARVLFLSAGAKQDRDRAYAVAMDRMHAAHPDDIEVEVFDALAKLGVSVWMADSTRIRMEAGALALDAYSKNPDHPGAAHFVIHAFDDPDHAILALPAARRYAGIAPDAAHARHMPSHIFVQLGMWPEAIASCQAAIDISMAKAAAKGEPRWTRENHSGRWLVNLYLEQGRPAASLAELKRIGESTPHTRKARSRVNYAGAALAYLLDSGNFDKTDEVMAPLLAPYQPDGAATPAPTPAATPAAAAPALAAAPGAARSCAATHTDTFALPYDEWLTETVSQIHAYAAVARHDLARARTEARAIHAQIASRKEPMDKAAVEHDEWMLRAAIARAEGNLDLAATDVRKAIELEKAMPAFSGPSDGFSAWETLGETLLAHQKPGEAAAAFENAIKQHPGRARSLLGAARAAAATGDHTGAAAAYARVVAIWQNAEEGWPGLSEARANGAHADAR